LAGTKLGWHLAAAGHRGICNGRIVNDRRVSWTTGAETVGSVRFCANERGMKFNHGSNSIRNSILRFSMKQNPLLKSPTPYLFAIISHPECGQGTHITERLC